MHGILVYQRIGNDIAIDGKTTSNGGVTLTETGAAGKRTGQWALSLSQPVESEASPGLVGRWTDPSGGRIRTVRLDRWTPLAAEPVASPIRAVHSPASPVDRRSPGSKNGSPLHSRGEGR